MAELRAGVKVPLDEHTTLVLIPNAVVEVRNSAGEPVLDEPVLVKRGDGSITRMHTNGQGNVNLYGTKNEAFNVTLVGRPKFQQGEAKRTESDLPCAMITVNAPNGKALANEEVVVERPDGTQEKYFTDNAGRVRVLGDPGENLKVCLAKQLKGSVNAA